jgi:hypothetical protein
MTCPGPAWLGAFLLERTMKAKTRRMDFVIHHATPKGIINIMVRVPPPLDDAGMRTQILANLDRLSTRHWLKLSDRGQQFWARLAP